MAVCAVPLTVVSNVPKRFLNVEVTQMPQAWLSGCVAGGVHAVSGPDHLAALIPLCMNKGMKAFREGAIWGLGHGLGCSIMGLAGVIFKSFIDIHLVSEYMEYVVGFTLILLGLLGIRRSQKWRKHGPSDHNHGHHHDLTLLSKSRQPKRRGDIECGLSINEHHSDRSLSIIGWFGDILDHSPSITILITGIIHGFSGTGHLLGVIPALTYKDITNGMEYLSAFCVGTALSMSVFTMFVGMIGDMITSALARNSKKNDENGLNQRLPALISLYASMFSIVVGVIWIIQPFIHTLLSINNTH